MRIRAVSVGLGAVILLCLACNNKRRIYSSECSRDTRYKHVTFTNLIDSIKYYNKQYVEVSGKYIEGKHVSALTNDSMFVNHSASHELWVNFTQDCPLYLSGTQKGLFESEDGSFNQINNRYMTIRGWVDVKQKGHKKAYRGTIDQVSFLELY